jgi:hypothetical protein
LSQLSEYQNEQDQANPTLPSKSQSRTINLMSKRQVANSILNRLTKQHN